MRLETGLSTLSRCALFFEEMSRHRFVQGGVAQEIEAAASGSGEAVSIVLAPPVRTSKGEIPGLLHYVVYSYRDRRFKCADPRRRPCKPTPSISGP